MNRKILILSSDKTGHGHESIVQALKEQFSELYRETEIRTVNGFSIGGPFGRFMEQLHLPVIKYFPVLWKLFFSLTSKFPYAVDMVTSICIKKAFIKTLREFQPDIIITVHAAFVGSVNNLLERYGFNIPLVVLVADLVTISGLWADPRSSCIFSPTEEGKSALMSFGVAEEKIRIFGFPVRKRFCRQDPFDKLSEPVSSSLNLIVFANVFNKGRTVSIVKRLLGSFDCTVTLITGRDEKLKRYIEARLAEKAGSRLSLPGYVSNMEHYLQTGDILITKAGPNILMEAIHCGIPVIISGNLPGQEEGTSEWIVEQGLGVTGYKVQSLIAAIRNLIEDNRYMLKKIKDSQLKYENRNAASEMVNYISGYTAKNDAFSELTGLGRNLSTL